MERLRRLMICTQAAVNMQKRLVDATLEEKRAEGGGQHVVAVLYDPSRITIHLSDDELVQRCFKKRGSDGSVVDCIYDVELELAGQGVRSLDARGDHRGLASRLLDALSLDDRVLVGAGCTVAIVPKGFVFASSARECSFHDEIRHLASRARVLSYDAIAFLKERPEFWGDLLNEALDPYRPFIPKDPASRNKLRELGNAAWESGGRDGGSLVKFNKDASFRTAAAVAEAIHATPSVEINR